MDKKHQYVTFRPFIHKILAAGADEMKWEFPYGAVVEERRGILMTRDGVEICTAHSKNGREHFAYNGDGNGLERGALSYAIAHAPRKDRYGFRMNDIEQYWLPHDWPQYMAPGGALLFNDAFYHAPISDLRAIADRLHIELPKVIVQL